LNRGCAATLQRKVALRPDPVLRANRERVMAMDDRMAAREERRALF
jgi:hypothetical protein